jgi:YVTN family beta-propeller protein
VVLCSALLAVLAAAAPAASPAPAAAGTLVVLNKSEASASLIDLATGSIVATVATGEGPHEVAVSPDGRRALATNYGTQAAPGSTLTLIDVESGKALRTIALGEHRRPHGVAWLPDGKRAAVTVEASRALLVVDADAGTVEAAIKTDQDVSHMVALGADGARAFVASIGSGSVTLVDLAARKVLATAPTGAGAEGIAVSPDGKEVWVTNRAADTVSVLDTAALRPLATLESKAFPIRVRFTPDGGQALVANARSGDVAVFDTKTRREVRRLRSDLKARPGGGAMLTFGESAVPVGIVVSPDGTRAFVAHTSADAIAVFDLVSGKAADVLRAGREPDGMAFSPVLVRANR